MIWRDEYSIGVANIDKQHKGLFTMTSRLLQILGNRDSERNRRACIEAIKYLKSYALNHFADEEAYQRSIGYVHYEQHKRQHEQFTENLAVMEQDMVEQQFSPDSIRVFVGALSAWLLHHIMCSDQDIVGHAYNVNPEHSQDPALVLQRVVLEEGKSIFGKEPTLVDNNFQGDLPSSERFIVVDCETSGGRKLRTLAALSLHLSVRLTQALLSSGTTQDADILTQTTVENLFSLMILRFAENFYSSEQCQASQTHSLRQKEILPMVPQNPPMCSLLFDSAFGSFMVRTWNRD